MLEQQLHASLNSRLSYRFKSQCLVATTAGDSYNNNHNYHSYRAADPRFLNPAILPEAVSGSIASVRFLQCACFGISRSLCDSFLVYLLHPMVVDLERTVPIAGLEYAVSVTDLESFILAMCGTLRCELFVCVAVIRSSRERLLREFFVCVIVVCSLRITCLGRHLE